MKKTIAILDGMMKGGIIVTTVIMTLTCSLQVLSRFILTSSFSWTEELSRFSFIWWTFFGATYVVRLNGHLGMDFFVNRFPEKIRAGIQRLVFVITLGFSALVLYQGIKITYLQAGQKPDLMPISMAWVYAVVPVSGLCMSIYLVYLIFFCSEPPEINANQVLPGETAPKGAEGPANGS